MIMESEEREYLKAVLQAWLTEVTPCLNEEQIVAFYSGRLGENEMGSVRDHLAECPRCLEMARDARQFLKAMSEPAQPAAKSASLTTIAPAIVIARSSWTSLRQSLLRRFDSPALGFSLALATLLLAIGFNVVGPRGIFTADAGILPVPFPSSAARNWAVHNSNDGDFIVTRRVPSAGPMPPFRLYVRTGGNEGGVFQIFAPDDAGPRRVLASAWVYVVSGRVVVGTGNRGSITNNSLSNDIPGWQLIQACSDGRTTNNWFIIYNTDADGGEFYVDAAGVRPW